MLKLTKLSSQSFILNIDLIETIEQTPDTVITMTTGNKYVVKESPDEIMHQVLHFKGQIYLANSREE